MGGWDGGRPLTVESVGFFSVGGWPRAVANASGGMLTSVPAARDCAQPVDFQTLVRSPMKLYLVTLLLSYFHQPDSDTLSLARVATPFIHSGHAWASTSTAPPLVVVNQLPPPLPPPPRRHPASRTEGPARVASTFSCCRRRPSKRNHEPRPNVYPPPAASTSTVTFPAKL